MSYTSRNVTVTLVKLMMWKFSRKKKNPRSNFSLQISSGNFIGRFCKLMGERYASWMYEVCVCVQQSLTRDTFKSEEKIIDNNFFTK